VAVKVQAPKHDVEGTCSGRSNITSHVVYILAVYGGISRLQSNGMFVLTDASLGLLIECWQQRQILVSNTRFARYLHEHSISVFFGICVSSIFPTSPAFSCVFVKHSPISRRKSEIDLLTYILCENF
jgi:hypothetical protein